jgi:hypothetical protein
MTTRPISTIEAMQWVAGHIGTNCIAANLHWVFVRDVQYIPRYVRSSYLIAGDKGLYGVVGFERPAQETKDAA